MVDVLSAVDWRVRLFIYQSFVEHAKPPRITETAATLGITELDVQRSYQRLDAAHQIALEPGANTVRMANPLSAIESPFRVNVRGRELFANCAWDSLGIPAMLDADATIEAVYAHANGSHSAARYSVTDGELSGDTGLVHFPLPVRRWYDDLIHT